MAKKPRIAKSRAEQLGYVEDLTQPIVAPTNTRHSGKPSTIYNNPESMRLSWEQQERSRKFQLLLRHYNLNSAAPNDLARLGLLLAIDWVPGFEVLHSKPKRPGRPPSEYDEEYLVTTIGSYLEANRKWTLPEALDHFKSMHKDMPGWSHLPATTTFRNIYDNARKNVKFRHAREAKQAVDRMLKGAQYVGKLLVKDKLHK